MAVPAVAGENLAFSFVVALQRNQILNKTVHSYNYFGLSTYNQVMNI
jgi:hypothetical protein